MVGKSIALLCFLAMGFPARAADLTVFTNEEHKVVITLSGDIVVSDPDRLWSLLSGFSGAGMPVAGIRLNSGGGLIAAGERIANAVREEKLPTIVVAGAACSSACFLIFAAGIERYAGAGARIGVHSATDLARQETGDALAATVLMARFATGLGVPPAIVGRMVSTPPAEMAWLSIDELRSMGVVVPGVERPAPAPVFVQSQPLSRPRPLRSQFGELPFE